MARHGEGWIPSSSEAAVSKAAQILSLVTGFIGPMILYATNRKQPFAAESCRRALNFQLTFASALLLISVLGPMARLPFQPYGAGLVVLVFVLNVFFTVRAIVASTRRDMPRYPALGFVPRAYKPPWE